MDGVHEEIHRVLESSQELLDAQVRPRPDGQERPLGADHDDPEPPEDGPVERSPTPAPLPHPRLPHQHRQTEHRHREPWGVRVPLPHRPTERRVAHERRAPEVRQPGREVRHLVERGVHVERELGREVQPLPEDRRRVRPELPEEGRDAQRAPVHRQVQREVEGLAGHVGEVEREVDEPVEPVVHGHAGGVHEVVEPGREGLDVLVQPEPVDGRGAGPHPHLGRRPGHQVEVDTRPRGRPPFEEPRLSPTRPRPQAAGPRARLDAPRGQTATPGRRPGRLVRAPPSRPSRRRLPPAARARDATQDRRPRNTSVAPGTRRPSGSGQRVTGSASEGRSRGGRGDVRGGTRVSRGPAVPCPPGWGTCVPPRSY